ncbi:MAG: hypothetical protein EOO28_14680 [Comamonadaceae bacterium]|nr:MAG: hypothetical protein EOO28_14680 [Comamonadaceae bacterium]
MFVSTQILGRTGKTLAAAGIVSALVLLAACGQTGPLYLPVPPVVPVRATAPSTSADAPGTAVPPLGAASAASQASPASATSSSPVTAR